MLTLTFSCLIGKTLVNAFSRSKLCVHTTSQSGLKRAQVQLVRCVICTRYTSVNFLSLVFKEFQSLFLRVEENGVLSRAVRLRGCPLVQNLSSVVKMITLFYEREICLGDFREKN